VRELPLGCHPGHRSWRIAVSLVTHCTGPVEFLSAGWRRCRRASR